MVIDRRLVGDWIEALEPWSPGVEHLTCVEVFQGSKVPQVPLINRLRVLCQKRNSCSRHE